MKNRELYERVSKKTGYPIETVTFLVNYMYRTVDEVLRKKEYFNIKIPGFANIKLSLYRVNQVLQNKSIKDLRKDRTNQKYIDDFRQLWELRQKLIKHEIGFKKNRPKQFIRNEEE